LTEAAFVASAEAQTVWDYMAVPAESASLRKTVLEVLTQPTAWHRVNAHLDDADHNVKMAGGIPPLVGFHGIKRWLVKRLASLFIYGTKVVTGPQKACSQSLLYSVRALLKIVRDREKDAVQQTTRLMELESLVAELKQRTELQERAIARQAEDGQWLEKPAATSTNQPSDRKQGSPFNQAA
jgi:hypothetical protein